MAKQTFEQSVHALELIVDNHSLPSVLGMLVRICQEKADHIRSNYQDETSARYWDARANNIELIRLPE